MLRVNPPCELHPFFKRSDKLFTAKFLVLYCQLPFGLQTLNLLLDLRKSYRKAGKLLLGSRAHGVQDWAANLTGMVSHGGIAALRCLLRTTGCEWASVIHSYCLSLPPVAQRGSP